MSEPKSKPEVRSAVGSTDWLGRLHLWLIRHDIRKAAKYIARAKLGSLLWSKEAHGILNSAEAILLEAEVELRPNTSKT